MPGFFCGPQFRPLNVKLTFLADFLVLIHRFLIQISTKDLDNVPRFDKPHIRGHH